MIKYLLIILSLIIFYNMFVDKKIEKFEVDNITDYKNIKKLKLLLIMLRHEIFDIQRKLKYFNIYDPYGKILRNRLRKTIKEWNYVNMVYQSYLKKYKN